MFVMAHGVRWTPPALAAFLLEGLHRKDKQELNSRSEEIALPNRLAVTAYSRKAL
jgi:hypothetical protein